MTFAEMLRDMPAQMRKLPKDAKGRPIPFFVDRVTTPWRDGCPDFRVMSGVSMRACIMQHRCWVCGERLTRWPICTFVAGPLSGLQRRTVEPPCHLACATWAAQGCPFLAHPGRGYDKENMDATDIIPVDMIKSGVTMLWTCRGYRHECRNNLHLFYLPDPLSVMWFHKGRLATREEVQAAITANLPKLSAAGIAVDTAEFERYLP